MNCIRNGTKSIQKEVGNGTLPIRCSTLHTTRGSIDPKVYLAKITFETDLNPKYYCYDVVK